MSKVHFVIAEPGQVIYEAAFSFAQKHFRRVFNATLAEPAPRYGVIHLGDHLPVGVIGIRHLDWTLQALPERYVGVPIEHWMQANLGAPVSRSQLVEAGSLAVNHSQFARFVLYFGTLYASLNGHSHIIFTATRTLRLLLGRLGLSTTTVCEAAPDVLDGASRQAWGDYYSNVHRPQVLLLETETAFLRIRARLRQEATIVRQLAMELQNDATARL